MSSKFNVAVIGYGMSAKVFHIPLISSVPTLNLYAIVQRHPKPEDDAEKDHPGIKSYRSAEEMTKDTAVDLVVITTIPETHVDLTKLALDSNKHVVVEKPFTPTTDEADGLIELARTKSRLITVYQNRRWDSDFATLRRLIDQQVLGRVVEFESHFDRHRPQVPTTETWKTKAAPASGAIYDLGTHLIDQALVMFGLPERVTAFVGSQRQGGPEGFDDSCTILLHYPHSLLVTIKAGVVSPELEQLRYWVRGENASYQKFGMDCQEDQLKSGMKPGDQGFAVEAEQTHGYLTTIDGDLPRRRRFPPVDPPTYAEFYRQLAHALAGKGKVPVDAQEARNVIRIIELARQSSRDGRTVPVENGMGL
ncbi:MAG: hypothetical protein M1817_006335 [Caeruleum heppii]|nr:MAG: hypothetical protein M1817_006335 [Caeruleum heppii]